MDTILSISVGGIPLGVIAVILMSVTSVAGIWFVFRETLKLKRLESCRFVHKQRHRSISEAMVAAKYHDERTRLHGGAKRSVF